MKILKDYIFPIVLIPILLLIVHTPFVLFPKNVENLDQHLFKLLPVMWIFLTIIFICGQLILNKKIKVSYIRSFTSLTISFILISGLFSLLKWPGAFWALMTGSLTFIILLSNILLKRIKTKV